jgi:hypothetical protein
MRPHPLTLAAPLLLALVLAARTSAADDADDALARSREAEARGDLAAASSELEPMVAKYPQDYLLALELAELAARRGHAEEAIRGYRVAVQRSPRAEVARAGLMGELAREGRCAEIVEVAAGGPDGLGRDAVASCEQTVAARPRVAVGLAYTNMQFAGHLYKSGANGATASVDVPVGAWTFGLTGRHLSISSRDASVMSPFTQQEGYARVGVGDARLGASLQLGVVRDGSGSLGTSVHAGTALRWSPRGDLVLAAAVSGYSDQTILRISPSYRAALGHGVSLTPALALQRADGKAWGSGSLTVAYDAAGWGLLAGGKYGEEVRPAYLTDAVVYDLTEHVMWGAFASARVRLTSDLALRASYSFDRLQGSTSGATVTSNLHAFSVGPVFEF